MTLAEIRELARKRPEQEFVLNRLYGAHVSPYLTYVCLRLGLSPDQVTIVGAAFGALGAAALFAPLGWWSVGGVLALQAGYVLDFSDGQVARATGRTSSAGSYLDWLTHFYIPVAAALATAASLAWATGTYAYLVLGVLASLELAAFAFSCKEHVLIAMARADPRLAIAPGYQAALRDDARPSDVDEAERRPPDVGQVVGIAGRAHPPTLRSVVGELLIYPGAVHLLTLAVVIDTVLVAAGATSPSSAASVRGLVLAAWAALFLVHAPMAIHRNYHVIRAVERAARSGRERGGA